MFAAHVQDKWKKMEVGFSQSSRYCQMNGTEREKELRYSARKMIIVMAKEEDKNIRQVVVI